MILLDVENFVKSHTISHSSSFSLSLFFFFYFQNKIARNHNTTMKVVTSFFEEEN